MELYAEDDTRKKTESSQKEKFGVVTKRPAQLNHSGLQTKHLSFAGTAPTGIGSKCGKEGFLSVCVYIYIYIYQKDKVFSVFEILCLALSAPLVRR